ncbi:hypothetical protein ACQP3C_28355, partial [Escherichia coli]
ALKKKKTWKLLCVGKTDEQDLPFCLKHLNKQEYVMDQQDGSMHTGACCQACQAGFDLWDRHVVRR